MIADKLQSTKKKTTQFWKSCKKTEKIATPLSWDPSVFIIVMRRIECIFIL